MCQYSQSFTQRSLEVFVLGQSGVHLVDLGLVLLPGQVPLELLQLPELFIL